MDLTVLGKYGIDYKDGILRCMNDEEFFVRMLMMFPDDSSFERAGKSLLCRNYRAMFEALHELKGACGNVAMTELFDAVTPLVELLRSGCEDESVIVPMYVRVEEAYTRAIAGINELKEEQARK